MKWRLGCRTAMSCSSHLPGFPGCLSAIRADIADERALLGDELDHGVDVFNVEVGDGPAHVVLRSHPPGRGARGAGLSR
jgi:hypothetical protein